MFFYIFMFVSTVFFSEVHSRCMNEIFTPEHVRLQQSVAPLFFDRLEGLLEQLDRDTSAFITAQMNDPESPIYWLMECTECVFNRADYPDNRRVIEESLIAYACSDKNASETLTFTSLASCQLLQELILVTKLVMRLPHLKALRINLIDLQYARYENDPTGTHVLDVLFSSFMQWIYALSQFYGKEIDVHFYVSATEASYDAKKNDVHPTDILALIDVSISACGGIENFRACIEDFLLLLRMSNTESIACSAISHIQRNDTFLNHVIRYDIFRKSITGSEKSQAGMHQYCLKWGHCSTQYISDIIGIDIEDFACCEFFIDYEDVEFMKAQLRN